MNGADILRERLITQRAVRSYNVMYDELATDAQTQLGAGKPISSALLRHAAELAVRAASAETDDPDPVEVPWCDCSVCVAYLGRSRSGS